MPNYIEVSAGNDTDCKHPKINPAFDGHFGLCENCHAIFKDMEYGIEVSPDPSQSPCNHPPTALRTISDTTVRCQSCGADFQKLTG